MLNARFPSDWITQARDALARLADRPWLLFAVLLAVNTIARPYAGITHDARLYSVQVLNHVEGGTYADDLFFRYGSQDQYSLFSRLAGPLVALLGVHAAFFVIYVVGKSLLIFGMMRLVQTLIPNRTALALSLIASMAISISYGGHQILNIQETFVTPRMVASAFVLIGIDWMLRGRPIAALALVVGATAIHPLMALGGILIWSAYIAWKHLGVRIFLGALAGVTAIVAGVLCYEPLATRCFGTMDDAWRQAILSASSFNFPSEWSLRDYAFLGYQLAAAVLVWAKFRHVDADKARFVAVLMLVTLVGLAGAALAERLPYALLLQGQPYRVMWVLGFLHLAFAVWLWVEWAQNADWRVQFAACRLLACLCWNDGLLVEGLFAAFVLPIVVLVIRGMSREPNDPRWLIHSLQLSIVIGSIAWFGYKALLLTSGWDRLWLRQPELRDNIEVYLANLGPVVMAVASTAIVVKLAIDRLPRLHAAWLTSAALIVQLGVFAIPETAYYQDHCTTYRGDLARVRDVLEEHHADTKRLPTVYCNLGCLDYVWLDLRSQCYFDWWQAGNHMFRREMAMEGRRRGNLIAPFEVARYRKRAGDLTDGDIACVARMFQIDVDQTGVTSDDLVRLCQEPNIDFVVIEQGFDGLYMTQVGRLFIYDCRQVRADRLANGSNPASPGKAGL